MSSLPAIKFLDAVQVWGLSLSEHQFACKLHILFIIIIIIIIINSIVNVASNYVLHVHL